MIFEIALVGVAAILVLLLTGRALHNRSTSRLAESLASGRRATPGRIDWTVVQDLPEPVARYLRHVLGERQRPIRLARLSERGRLRTDPDAARWTRFRARQVIAPAATGFVWDARVAVAPLTHVGVRDAYVDGIGSGEVSVLSAIPVSRARGGLEMNSGSLHRYLAEAVWCPTALLPGDNLRWEPIDGRKALATLTNAGVTVSLEFWFDESAEVVGVYSPGRWGRFGGGFQQVPWEGHFRDYHARSGVLVPSYGEVGWYRSGQWQCVWQGEVLDARYEFAD